MAKVGMLVFLLMLASSVFAQEASLIDVLQAKGVLSKQEAQRLKKSKPAKAEYDQAALIQLLQTKGVLSEQDLTALKQPTAPVVVATPAVSAAPDVTERLSRLESQQQTLEAQQHAQAEQQTKTAEELKKTTVADVKKSIDWLNRFSFSGDMRNRFEGIYQSHGPNATARNRERLRLRFGVTAKVTDEVLAGFRLVSGDPNDPISNMQTLGDAFTKKPISLDQAYITLSPKQSIGLGDWAWTPISITAGKFANPLFKPRALIPSEMLWDEDLMPEGTTETLTVFEGTTGVLRRLQLHAIQWTAREIASAADSWVFGGQAVAVLQASPALRWTGGLGQYYYAKSDVLAQSRNTNNSLKLTNSVILRDGTIVPGGQLIVPGSGGKQIKQYLGGFNIMNGSFQLEYDTSHPRWPFTLMGDFAHNFDAKNGKDFAFWAGASLGATKDPGDWAFSALWTYTDTNSVVSYFSYSDYGRDGGTNLQGPAVRVDYMLYPRFVLTAKNGFVSYIHRPSGQSNSEVYRLQLDATLAF